MEEDVFGAVPGFGIEKIEGVVRGGEVAVHTVRHETLFVVYVTGGLPGVVGKSYLMAGGAKLRCGGANHGVVGETEKWKCDDNADSDEDSGFYQLFHGSPLLAGCEALYRIIQGEIQRMQFVSRDRSRDRTLAR
jgi:hypothetical protein